MKQLQYIPSSGTYLDNEKILIEPVNDKLQLNKNENYVLEFSFAKNRKRPIANFVGVYLIDNDTGNNQLIFLDYMKIFYANFKISFKSFLNSNNITIKIIVARNNKKDIKLSGTDVTELFSYNLYKINNLLENIGSISYLKLDGSGSYYFVIDGGIFILDDSNQLILEDTEINFLFVDTQSSKENSDFLLIDYIEKEN